MPILTIDFNAQQAARMQAAITNVLALDHNATFEECRQFWISEMRRMVLEREKIVAEQALISTPFNPA